MVCVQKPNSLAYRGGVRKPGDFAGRVQEGTAGLGLRTKTEFIGFHGRRARTGGRLPNRFRAPRPPKFALENRIHWLSGQASANRGSRSSRFRAPRPLKFALENRIHWLSGQASANRGSRSSRFRTPRPLKFALENRIHWLSRETSANRGRLPSRFRAPGRPEGERRSRPAFKNKKTLKQWTFRSADSKFFHYILHPIYKEETYSFSPRAKRRMVRPTPSSSLLSAT